MARESRQPARLVLEQIPVKLNELQLNYRCVYGEGEETVNMFYPVNLARRYLKWDNEHECL